MTDTDKDPQQIIEQCFEEIKQVLKKYDCKIEICKKEIEIYNSDFGIYYKQKNFNK